MIKTETIVINGNKYLRTYSTTGKYVVRDGIKYSEAIDLPNVYQMPHLIKLTSKPLQGWRKKYGALMASHGALGYGIISTTCSKR